MIKDNVNAIKKLLLLVCILLLISKPAYATTITLEENLSNLPMEVQNDIKGNLSQDLKPQESTIKDGIIMSLEEFNEYKKNLCNYDNNNSTTKNLITPMTVPNDSYIYVPSDIIINNYAKKPKYKYIGYVQIENGTNSNMTLSYEQEESKTVNWNVAASLSGSATFGTKLLGAVETKVGVEVSRSSTVSAGKKIGTTATCLPGKKLTLTAYKGGIFTEVTTVYNKYHISGGMAGAYTEKVSGTVVRVFGLTLSAVETNLY